MKENKGGAAHQLTLVPNLTKTMEEKHCTIPALAKFSGVSYKTIERARNGLMIHVGLAGAIIETLAKFAFNRKKPGPKDKAKPFILPVAKDAESTNVRVGYMKNFHCEDNPDLVHTLRTTSNHGCSHRLPVEKSEAEIERMWEYNQMIGRR